VGLAWMDSSTNVRTQASAAGGLPCPPAVFVQHLRGGHLGLGGGLLSPPQHKPTPALQPGLPRGPACSGRPPQSTLVEDCVERAGLADVVPGVNWCLWWEPAHKRVVRVLTCSSSCCPVCYAQRDRTEGVRENLDPQTGWANPFLRGANCLQCLWKTWR